MRILFLLALLLPFGLSANDFSEMLKIAVQPTERSDKVAEELKESLNRHFEQAMESWPLAPYFVSIGLGGEEFYFEEYHEALSSFALAYPYLDKGNQEKAGKVMSDLLKKNLSSGIAHGSQGSFRESWQVPENFRKKWNPNRPHSVEAAYSLWLVYSRVPSLKGEVEKQYKKVLPKVQSALKDFEGYKKKDSHSVKDKDPRNPDVMNQVLAGFIGLARLAKEYKDDAYSVIEQEANKLIEIRLEIFRDLGPELGKGTHNTPKDKQVEEKGSHLFVSVEGQGARCLQYTNLVPEVATFLAKAEPEHHKRMTSNIDSFMPGWYLAHDERLMAQEVPHWVDPYRKHQAYVYSESYINFPDVPYALFCVKALIEKTSIEKLARYADIPWCKGDLYFINKLVYALELGE